MAAAVAVDPATAMAPTSPAVPGRGSTDADALFARLSTTSLDEEMARTLTGDVESLQRTADRQMTKLTTLNSSLNKKLRKLEADAAHLGGENANLRRAYINLLAELRAAQAAAAELAAKEAELATATSNYDGARRTVKELKARLKRNIADGKALQTEKESVEAQLAELNAANEVKTREAGEELMAAAAARTVLERDLEAAKTEATERSVALETTAEEKARLEGEVASLNEQISGLNASLEEARRNAEEAQLAKQDAEAKLSAAEGRVDEVEESLKGKEEVSRSLASTSADKSGLEAELARLRQEMQDMKDAHESAMLALVTAKEDEKAQLLAVLERDVTGAIDKQKGEVDESRRMSVARLSSGEPPAAVAASSAARSADAEPEGGAFQSGAGPRMSMASSAGQSDYTEGTYEEEPASMPMGADTIDDSEGATTPRTSTTAPAMVPVAADGGAVASRDIASDDGEVGATAAPDAATTDDLAAVEAELAEEGVRTAAQAEAEMTAEAALQAVSSEPVIAPVTGVQISGEQPGSPASVVIVSPEEAAAKGTTRGIDDAADVIAAKKKKEAEAVKAADKGATKGGARTSAGTDKTKMTSDASTAQGAKEGSSGGRITGFFKSCGCFSSE
ncbi:hypothetical protein I4F81_012058 [Pyropia yezoensis]|uniref:Uncharacterized protein n=1 Tax=Pyropia yezoensis TaxID=2788 RepID=A0ACC3CH03_PYRYE|nr:hypothetical protein I4F81_012058 [Neopyropia yezoensis]